jgi:hypothetical protein
MKGKMKGQRRAADLIGGEVRHEGEADLIGSTGRLLLSHSFLSLESIFYIPYIYLLLVSF